MKFKTQIKWTDDEIELLKHHWVYALSKNDLHKVFPNRTHSSLMNMARRLNLKTISERKRHGNLSFLDKLTTSSCYWWGFIIADGHLTSRGELIINLNNQDKEHLIKLSKHLNTNIKTFSKSNGYSITPKDFCILRIQDKTFGKKWLSILNITAPKTYFPPDLSIFLNKENLLSFFIGLIDGDGCIWSSKNWLNLRVELHGNWLNTLELISIKLKEFYDIDSKVKLTKRGSSKIDINRKKDLNILKNYVNNVDYLERKWSKLDIL